MIPDNPGTVLKTSIATFHNKCRCQYHTLSNLKSIYDAKPRVPVVNIRTTYRNTRLLVLYLDSEVEFLGDLPAGASSVDGI